MGAIKCMVCLLQSTAQKSTLVTCVIKSNNKVAAATNPRLTDVQGVTEKIRVIWPIVN